MQVQSQGPKSKTGSKTVRHALFIHDFITIVKTLVQGTIYLVIPCYSSKPNNITECTGLCCKLCVLALHSIVVLGLIAELIQSMC